ncbi:DEAD/DEAH box helicase [Paracnuella aquatica]|uniref:DEAD/DEAH box helicase n=1 Tax=Paracnuella aquatica TaxID=2268757 RepID=UPI000DEEE6B9|nr:DEAD/DEAH box helicase [Paracnuella aquatica]RPD46688.1 DEAD/DEAH box helicase [Paracnuella aquatica]
MNYELNSILAALNFKALNEMQEAAISAASEQENIVLLSPTGSGKTLAFLLPLLIHLEKGQKETGALIVVPTRELALQIEDVFRKMGTGLKITACYGGHKRETEENELLEAPAIIVGTPGRLGDHIRRGNITTKSIHSLVLDEFDKSLELGFVEEIEEIISQLPAVQRRMLTSATETVAIPEFLSADFHRLNFLPEDAAPVEKLEIMQVESPDSDKIGTLVRFLCTVGNRATIVFCNHRESVERVHHMLHEKGIISVFYHGAMEQKDREVALAKFRNSSINYLITTDLAARGLDIFNIRYIVHYHLPANEDIFTHRNGRTARMEASGTAVLMVGPDEKLPAYLAQETPYFDLDETAPLPEKPKWTTMFVAAGKKDKVNKVDIVGFLAQQGGLKKEDIGVIEVKDFFSFVALRRNHVSYVLKQIEDKKLKGKKIKIAVAK